LHAQIAAGSLRASTNGKNVTPEASAVVIIGVANGQSIISNTDAKNQNLPPSATRDGKIAESGAAVVTASFAASATLYLTRAARKNGSAANTSERRK